MICVLIIRCFILCKVPTSYVIHKFNFNFLKLLSFTMINVSKHPMHQQEMLSIANFEVPHQQLISVQLCYGWLKSIRGRGWGGGRGAMLSTNSPPFVSHASKTDPIHPPIKDRGYYIRGTVAPFCPKLIIDCLNTYVSIFKLGDLL